MIRSALAGVLSAAAGVAAAELVAAGLDRPAAAPVFAVGGTVIDATPMSLMADAPTGVQFAPGSAFALEAGLRRLLSRQLQHQGMHLQ